MRVLFELNHDINPSGCAVTVTYKSPKHQGSIYLDLSCLQSQVLLELSEGPQKSFDVVVNFDTNDREIISTPLEITNIIFDDFYSLPRITHSGHTLLENQCWHSLCEFEPSISDGTGCNTLSFVGTLHYRFNWPFFRLMRQ